MPLRVLLVESEPEYALFLREVLVEIEAGKYWTNWVHIEALSATSATEARAILVNEPVDIILLDPDLTDTRGLETFRRIQAIAPQVPMIVLADPEEDGLAIRVMREGAQDFLFRKQVDCAPLAHAMRNAIERHRLLAAARAATITDSLTGLPNRGGFLTFADRDRKIAERLGRRLMILVAEPKCLAEIASAYGEQRRDLTLVEAADHLRSIAGPTDLVARIGATRFGIVSFDTDIESLEETWARVHAAALSHNILIGAAIFDGDHPASLDVLLEQAALDLAPSALAMRQ
jgi:diguanylate cyclase (GGDEF)-like protein